MSKPIHRARLFAISLSLSAAAIASAATPALTKQRGARGVQTAFVVQSELGELDGLFVYGSRLIIDSALADLRASTTFAALLAPAGVTLNCPISGTLFARITNTWPRTLKLDWTHCVRIEFTSRVEADGPAEVVLAENSLSPSVVLSIRFGDRNRDYVSDQNFEIPSPTYGGQTLSRNLRITGVLPMTREYQNANFLGRYLVEAKGFVRRVQRLPDYNSAGEPSVEFYDFSNTLSTEGALLTGFYTVDGFDNLQGAGLIAGKVSGRYIYPVRPTKPMRTLDKWFKGAGLSTRIGYDNDVSKYSIWVDGKVEGDFNEFWPLGCTGAETYTFRTRAPLTPSPLSYSFEQFESGEIVIDGKMTAKFSATVTEPFVDVMAHVGLEIPGVGTFNYDYPYSVLEGPLNEAGLCTP